jgi:hypothetical protein
MYERAAHPLAYTAVRTQWHLLVISGITAIRVYTCLLASSFHKTYKHTKTYVELINFRPSLILILSTVPEYSDA